MKTAFSKLEGDLSGEYYPLLGMEEEVRQKLVDDHFLFMSGDKVNKTCSHWRIVEYSWNKLYRILQRFLL